MAYLTTQIGPGTRISVKLPPRPLIFQRPSSLTPIFSGLDLGAATYYLIIIETATGSANGIWNGTEFPNISLAPTLTANGEYDGYSEIGQSYVPAASYGKSTKTSFDFTITGTPVPEPPASWLILFAGGIGVLSHVRNRVGFGEK